MIPHPLNGMPHTSAGYENSGTLTQLVIVGEAETIYVTVFGQSKCKVGPTEGVHEVNFPFDFDHLRNQQTIYKYKNKN